jgi:hypothetical protein
VRQCDCRPDRVAWTASTSVGCPWVPSVMPEDAICISLRRVQDQRGELLDEPRPLSESEKRTLDAMLGSEFLGVAELRAQLPHVKVIGKCHCTCPTVDLFVPSEIPPSGVVTRSCLAPVVGHVHPIQRGETRELLVQVDDGRLTRLAYISSDDPWPTEWPSLDRLSVSVMNPPIGPPVKCKCPTCETGLLLVPQELVGPGYLIEPIPSGYETVCQPWTLGDHTFPNCGLRHRTVDEVGWVQVPEPSDS